MAVSIKSFSTSLSVALLMIAACSADPQPQFDDEFRFPLTRTVPGDKVFNGFAVGGNSFQYFVRRITIDNEGNLSHQQRCAGCLIGQEWVLTASHCLADKTTSEVRSDLYGFEIGYRCDDPTKCDQSARRIVKADRFYIPNGFRSSEFYLNDVAIAHLTEVVTDIPYAAPDDGKLYSSLTPYVDDLRVVGAGVDETGGFSDSLRAADLSVMPQKICESEWGRPDGSFDNRLFCLSIRNGSQTCSGDSGGPVVSSYRFSDNGLDIVAGVISGGEEIPCELRTRPTLYAKVSTFYSFVSDTVCTNSILAGRPSWCPLVVPDSAGFLQESGNVDSGSEVVGADGGSSRVCRDERNFRTDVSDPDSKLNCSVLAQNASAAAFYCGNTQSTASKKCRRSCGICEYDAASAENSEPCVDETKFRLDRNNADSKQRCEWLNQGARKSKYCGNAGSNADQKCRVTCGTCNNSS